MRMYLYNENFLTVIRYLCVKSLHDYFFVSTHAFFAVCIHVEEYIRASDICSESYESRNPISYDLISHFCQCMLSNIIPKEMTKIREDLSQISMYMISCTSEYSTSDRLRRK